MRADGDAGAQTQNPERIPVAHLLFHIVKERDNVAGIAIERTCRLGGRDRAPGALKQPHAVMLLQLPDGNAQRRLRQMQLLRRARHTAAAVDRCEDFHVPQRQDFPALSYKIFHMIRIS